MVAAFSTEITLIHLFLGNAHFDNWEDALKVSEFPFFGVSCFKQRQNQFCTKFRCFVVSHGLSPAKDGKKERCSNRSTVFSTATLQSTHANLHDLKQLK